MTARNSLWDSFYPFVHGGYVCRRCGAVCGDPLVHYEWHRSLSIKQMVDVIGGGPVHPDPASSTEHTSNEENEAG